MIELEKLHMCRKDFPALSRQHNGCNLVYLDGPGGSQVPEPVIEAISHYYRNSNANTHGMFISSQETDGIIESARERMAAFLGASSSETISFGQNMTSLNYALSKALARYLPLKSEILITQLDHEANRGPWLALEEYGFKIREVKILPDGTLDYQDFQEKLSGHTALVAVGYASNALGTVNDLHNIRAWTHDVGSLLLVDAVHYAPHASINVTSLDCDFLLCSAYKFYGPHVGILYTRQNLLAEIPTDCLVTQEQQAPYKIETGTLNHAALAGVTAAVDYIAGFGSGEKLRSSLVNAMFNIQKHESALFRQMYQGLDQLPGLCIWGPAPNPDWHTPTISFTLEGHTPADICRFLAEKGVCAWDGHFYAQRTIEILGLSERGGVTRFGISMYTSPQEVDFVIDALKQIANGTQPGTKRPLPQMEGKL